MNAITWQWDVDIADSLGAMDKELFDTMTQTEGKLNLEIRFMFKHNIHDMFCLGFILGRRWA